MNTTSTMSAPTEQPTQMINGLDVATLRQTIAAITDDPQLGQTSWRVSSTWRGGTRTDHAVDGVMIGGQQIDRRFTLQIDEPSELGGTNRFANPQEYLLAALNACMMVGYSAVAALMGITLTKLEVEIDGDIDLRGFLAIDAGTPAGYTTLHQTVRIAGDAAPEQMQKLHALVQATSPNFFNITRPVKVVSELIVT